MKSTEGKPRGRPSTRRNKSLLKNSSASENENNKSILDFFSPPRTEAATLNEPKRGGSTPRRKKNPLANLQSNLSPKYIGFSSPTSTEKRRTKYRIAKLKDSDSSGSYFHSSRNLIGCVRRTTVSGRLRSPLSSPEASRRSANFVSPIDKLLRKNGAMKSCPSSPVRDIEMFNDVELTDDEKSDTVQSKKKNCVVKLAQMNHNEFIINLTDFPMASQDESYVSSKVIELKNTKIEYKEDDYILEEEIVNSAEEKESEIKETPEPDKSPSSNDITAIEISNFELMEVSEPPEAMDKDSTNGNVYPEIAPTKEVASITDDNDNIKESVDQSKTEQMLHIHENKFPNEDLPSIKSPSTFSVDSAKGSSLDNDLNWVSIETGDLFWGQIFQFSYWPCIVCPDPEGKTISVNENRGQMQHVMIHVRFFADNGRRSWVKRDNLLLYNGLDNYLKKRAETEQKYGKKSPKYKMFSVSKTKARIWNQAVREADLIDSISMEDRMEKFFELLEEVKVYTTLERKRRQSLYIHSSTSDISSMFDSTDNLYLKQTAKRDRSPTPVSPAYSPLGPKNSEKRIKLSNHSTSRASNLNEIMDETEAHSNEVTELKRSEEMSADTEFKKFVSAMRAYILGNTSDSKLEKQFMLNARSMWGLKNVCDRSHSETQNTPNAVKRLSQRLRNISIQKSLPSTPVALNEDNTKTAAKPKRAVFRPIEEVVDDIFQLDNRYLFRGVSKDPVCKACLKPGPDVVKCSKNCQGWVHPSCSASYLSESISVTDVVASPFVHITGDLDESSIAQTTKLQPNTPAAVCNECFLEEPNKCFVCNKAGDELARCNSHHCGKWYHTDCLKYWPQAKITKSAGKFESLRCPAHVCHTCVSDDPKGKFIHIEKAKLTKCIKCPATYHMDSTCIPAGSQFLSTALIICPRHNKQQEPYLNVNWCFICVSGGNLVCCETCPTAVHAECLKIPIADEGYICEECETGRMPLYGEMVWAKFTYFRWWPSLILPPTEVPANLARKAHNPFEFVIRFFGTNDHAWISRRRVYLYQEGDCSEPPKGYKKGLDHNYTKGVEEAKRISEIIKEKKILLRVNDKKQRISPPPYVKIKQNRAVPPLKLQVNLEKICKCECDTYSENPCSQDSGCLNRVLFTECNPKICPAGDRCQNQLFEKKVYPKVDVIYLNEKGFGLICLEPITSGTFVIEYVGEVIDDAEFRRRITQKEQERDENFYFLTLEKDYIIDAGPKGNMARFMNHSCDPNCETQKWSVNGLNRIGLFAIKDIPTGTELTFNYFWDELLGNEKKNCHCGAAKCAGLIGGKYKDPAKRQQDDKTKLKTRPSTKTKVKSPKIIRRKTKPKPKREGKLSKPAARVSIDLTSSTDTTPEKTKAQQLITAPTSDVHPSLDTTSSPSDTKQTETPQS